METPQRKLAYGFPMMPDNPGLKLALHAPSASADPDTISRDPAPGDEEEIRSVARLIRDADGPLLALRICMYTNSPDAHFIIDRHPHHPRVLLAAGFSGHGFKFASVIGQALADLAARGSTPLPIEFLSLRRFTS